MLDKDLIRRELESMAKSSGAAEERPKYLWSPPPGETQVRLLSYPHQPENPFIKTYMYYPGEGKVVKRSCMSPLTLGNSDPIAEFSEKARKVANDKQRKAQQLLKKYEREGNFSEIDKLEKIIEDSRRDWKIARKISPSLRIFLPILVRGEEEEGIRFWGFSEQMYQKLMRIILDPDWGDFTDYKQGRDAIITRQTPEEAKNLYGSIEISFKPNKTPLVTKDDPKAAMIVEMLSKDNFPNLLELMERRIPSAEEMMEWLDEFFIDDSVKDSLEGDIGLIHTSKHTKETNKSNPEVSSSPISSTKDTNVSSTNTSDPTWDSLYTTTEKSDQSSPSTTNTPPTVGSVNVPEVGSDETSDASPSLDDIIPTVNKGKADEPKTPDVDVSDIDAVLDKLF